MEKVWLMLSILTFLIGIYHSIQNTVYDALYFFGFSAVAIILFIFRRKQRQLYERNQSDD